LDQTWLCIEGGVGTSVDGAAMLSFWWQCKQFCVGLMQNAAKEPSV